MSTDVLNISQVNFYIRSIIESDKNLKNVFISGEISNFTNHVSSGHLYFSLKDDKSYIKCVMFNNFAKKIRFSPQNGQEVLVRGDISVYESTGQYQIIIKDMQPLGQGELNIEKMLITQKLLDEGLFDESHKKLLPCFPKRIGVITSKSGAVLHDIKDVLGRRYPLCEIILSDVLVQGSNASKSCINAIKAFNSEKLVDTIIIARGGGSAEDLSSFNDEMLARAVYNSEIPIISAIGHESDFTICDLVADVRAATPSVAAQIVADDIKSIYKTINNSNKRLDDAVKSKISSCKLKLSYVAKNKNFVSPIEKNKKNMSHLYYLTSSLNSEYIKKYNECNYQYLTLVSQLNSFNPVKTLMRGYSIATCGKEIVKSVNSIKHDDNIDVIVSDGTIHCNVVSIDKGNINE